ncbi:MAG: amidohydrolase family protein [Anaerolineales bacterium]
MNKLALALLIVGLLLAVLTNTGLLSFRQKYIYQLSENLSLGAPVTAFVDVTVIPMDNERTLEHQTVVVRDGIIERIGDSAQVEVPAEALVIDGRGRYLMPGLVDMHVHVEYPNDLLLFVANGVTTVRNMWGNTDRKLWFGLPDQLTMKKQIAEGKLFAPTIYTAGPVMEGKPANHPLMETFTSPEQAAESVAWQKAQGYDFVKVYDHLSPEIYEAILHSAIEQGLPTVGHVPFAVGLDGVLSSGQITIEHLTGYVDPDAVRFLIPEDELDEYAARTKDAGVWNCVTLTEYPKSKQTAEVFDQLQHQPGMVYQSPSTRLFSPFMYYMASQSHSYQGEDYPQRVADLNRRMVQALHNAGAGILLGTDSAQAYHLPGFSFHEELALLVEAGLTPYEALKAGTRDASLALGREYEFGLVAEGQRADLLLLEANPLEDVSNANQRTGVMLRGRWYGSDELQSMLAALADSYQPSLPERLWPLILIVSALPRIWKQKFMP